MFKLALSAGHGRYTAGKRCLKSLDPNETREWVLNSRICEKIEEKLKNTVSILRVDDRTGERDVDLYTRCTAANRFGADFYLSIHHNAGVKGKSGGGIVAYVYPGVDAATRRFQKEIYLSAVEKTALAGNRAVPLAEKALYELKKTKMPAVLLECGFMDSSTDIKHILTDAFAEKIALAVAEVISKYAATPEKTEEIKKEPVDSNAKCFPRATIKTVSIVNALKSVGANSSYTYRREIAAENNIEGYSGTAEQNLYMLSLLKNGTLRIPR